MSIKQGFKLEISTQYWENYSDDNTPYWKTKGEQIFQMYVDTDAFLYERDDCIKILKEMLIEQSNNFCKYTYITHEFKFREPITLNSDTFQQKLSQLNIKS